jgi:hypothetical protein
MHVRAQNAAVLVRVLLDHVRFEIFEVSPLASVVMSTSGKILCSYPGPAIQVSSEVFADASFRQELAYFLTQMDIDVLDKTVTRIEVGRTIHEIRETAHPRYISGLLVGILRGFGQPASVDRITKRIADEVLWKEAEQPWRRSPLWLVIRVALQTSLDRDIYKTFTLFFHTYLLQICIQKDFPSETLHLMRIKMARRLSKLDPRVPNGVFQVVNDTAKKTEELLQRRWTNFQRRQSTSPPWNPNGLDFDKDTAITLNNSRPYFMNVLNYTSGSYSANPFRPSHRPRLANTTDFRLFSDSQLTNAVANDGHVALADFELSVERHLDDWVKSCPPGDDLPDVIASCFSQYISSARQTYRTNPEENSIMILTCLDLWKALDTLAIRQCSLLKSYSPEIPQDFLHHLLLHRSSSLERAELIEKYISQRHGEAFCPTSIFSDDATETSFAARYYRTSPELQRLHDSINEHAGREREKKRAELKNKSAERQSLLDNASKMSHNHVGIRSWYTSCEKCDTDHKANYVKIHFHEWPLPQEPLKAQSVVFELSPPRAFSAWREITYAVLHDFGESNAATGQAEPKRLLDAYCGLRDRAVRHKYNRITIASTTLALYDDTHWGYAWLPADESKVLVDNALSFRLYDRTTNSWAGRSFQTSSSLCTPPIPASSPYGKLHSFVSRTNHTSNEIIAAQADCPPELSLHEYMAFSGLRSGPRLQWLNIAREVPSPLLSFHREEVHTLITQAAWQIGPLPDGVREWHLDLCIPSFGKTLLQELDALIGRIEANWKEEVTIRTIGMSDFALRFLLSFVQQPLALLTSRLLSSAQDSEICQTAYELLRKARSVAYKWIGELRSKLDETHDELSRANLGRRLCILAATCFSTYGVCPKHVPRILSSDLDFAIAVHCAVIVHDNTPPALKDDDSVYLSRLLKRHRRLLYFLEPFFYQGITSNPTGFDDGITKLWPDFRRQSSSNWHTLPGPNSRWITCTVGNGKEVHYNLLAGRLLLGGEPLGTLPLEVMKHSTYTSVLGSVSVIAHVSSHVLTYSLQRILDAGPADSPDMKFMTLSKVSGYQVGYCRC